MHKQYDEDSAFVTYTNIATGPYIDKRQVEIQRPYMMYKVIIVHAQKNEEITTRVYGVDDSVRDINEEQRHIQFKLGCPGSSLGT